MYLLGIFLWLLAPLLGQVTAIYSHPSYGRPAGPILERSYASNMTRLQKIQSMYAWEGFVYDTQSCPDLPQMVGDFTRMKYLGARNVITFEYCDLGADPTYYDTIIQAAGLAGINIIPLVWTLPIHYAGQNYTPVDTFAIKSVPRIYALTEAVIRNPDPVLAVALGDEPLYDDDAGSPEALASYILGMKASFQAAGLDIPVSISDMDIGWMYAGNITSVENAVDFFMINNLVYYNNNSVWGGDQVTWSNFMDVISYFDTLAEGRPILVTQTGWPSNENTWPSNSTNVQANVPSEAAYWNLLDYHCEDYFKPNNIGWMWRSWRDDIDGWGALYINGTAKFPIQARLTC